MKLQHRINRETEVSWQRCKWVIFEGETATWELQEKTYDLLEAYCKQPHRQLITAKDDTSLKGFIRAWGPLRHTLDGPAGSDPIQKYRTVRDELAWMARLRDAVENPEKQRAVLSDWNRVSDLSADDLVVPFSSRGEKLRIPTLVFDDSGKIDPKWLERAKAHEIEKLCIHLVNYLVPQYFPRYRVTKSRGRSVVKPSLGVDSLVTALHWMMWEDVFRNHPIQFCEECDGLIPSESRHQRKFCSVLCARRRTTREWQKRNREIERATNGTHKTR